MAWTKVLPRVLRSPGLRPSSSLPLAGVALGLLVAVGSAFAIEFGQIDTFEEGGTAGWQKGGATQLPIQNIADGGPDGAGDAYIRNEATGGSGADSRQVFYNNLQWTGNYNAAGVGAITLFANNLGATTLHLRVAIEGNGNRFGSTTATSLAPGSGWTFVAFDLTGVSLTRLQGSGTLESTLASVSEVRILSAQAGPDWRGDVVASLVGVDDVKARGSVIPVEEHSWGRVKTLFDTEASR